MYYKMEKYTDWQVMYSPSFMEKDKEYRREVVNKLLNSLSDENPIIPCILMHKHDDYRNRIDWEEEGKEEPPLEPPILKDVIEISGTLDLEDKRHGGIAISEKMKNALEKHDIDKHLFYKFQLEYKDKFYDYYFLIPDIQSPYYHIDFTRTEFLTRPKYVRNAKTMKRELIEPSVVIQVANPEDYIANIRTISIGVYNNKLLYINEEYDFFLDLGVYFVSNRFKDFLEKEGLVITFSKLSPADKVTKIITPEEV